MKCHSKGVLKTKLWKTVSHFKNSMFNVIRLLNFVFFEDRCTAYGITSDIEKFEIIQRIWPRPDILDFVEAYDEDRTYCNLYKFLEGKCSQLPCILGANPFWQGPVKFQRLYLSAKKWAKSKKEDRIKYFMFVHEPNISKNKIKKCFGLDYDEFIRRTELFHHQCVLTPVFSKTKCCIV